MHLTIERLSNRSEKLGRLKDFNPDHVSFCIQFHMDPGSDFNELFLHATASDNVQGITPGIIANKP